MASKRRRVEAALDGDEAAARDLVARGVDVDWRNPSGATPLFKAAQKGRDAVVRTLLDAGADKDLAKHTGATPLFLSLIHI